MWYYHDIIHVPKTLSYTLIITSVKVLLEKTIRQSIVFVKEVFADNVLQKCPFFHSEESTVELVFLTETGLKKSPASTDMKH